MPTYEYECQKCGHRFELFQMVDEYLDILAKKNAPLPDGYHDVKREATSAALSAGTCTASPVSGMSGA